MKERRFFFVPNAANETQLPPDEATHALRSLRLKSGDEIFLMDGEGCFYRAEITIAAAKHCVYEVKECLPQQKGWRGRIHIAMAPTKMMDRVEWFSEKATELGIDEMSFVNCSFSERKAMRTSRLERIVLSAVKQSRKPWRPIVNPLVSFKDFVRVPRQGQKFIAHCYEELQREDLYSILCRKEVAFTDDEITVLIGPEGDFSEEEVLLANANGYRSITLGSARLRTETAALLALTMAQLTRRLDE